MILVILLLIILSYTAFNVHVYFIRRKFRHIVSVPIPYGVYWCFGFFWEIRKRLVALGDGTDISDVFRYYHKELDTDLFQVPILSNVFIACYKLPIMSRMLTDRGAFKKTEVFRRVFSSVGGTRLFGDHGILNDPGTDLWVAKRRIMDTAFKKAFLRTTVDDLNKVADNLITTLSDKSFQDTFDITRYLAISALEAVSICGFAWDKEIFSKHVDDALRMTDVLRRTLALKFKERRTFEIPGCRRKEKNEFHQAVTLMREAVKEHLLVRLNGEEKDDILSYIIKANSVSDILTVEDIIDEYLVFVFAGMETTAITMSVVLFYISTHPEVYRRVQEEVDLAYGESEVLGFDEIAQLKYLEMTVKECLRLKPPARSTTRQCILDGVVVDGIAFPRGSIVFMNYGELHVDPRYWDDPLEFNPDRFATPKNITNYSFMPFSAGNRSCIGKSFAILESKLILSRIIHNFDIINPRPDVKVLPVVSKITSKPRDGVHVKLLPRAKAN